MLTERSVRFDAHEVLATLAGTKTQMRRAVKGETSGAFWGHRGWTPSVEGNAIVWRAGDVAYEHRMPRPCPYGVPGDRLWVKETFALSVRDPEAFERDTRNPTDWDGPVYRATHDGSGEWVRYGEDGKRAKIPAPWRPSIHMPRWASRMTLVVTGVRVERLHDITEEDARAEGVTAAPFTKSGRSPERAHVEAFEDLWRSTGGAASWAANPWVWVVEFRRLAR